LLDYTEKKKRKKYKPVYIYDDVSLNSSENGKTFRHSCGSENQNTHFMFNNFFPPGKIVLFVR